MKYISQLFFILLFSAFSFSKPIDSNTANALANNFITNHSNSPKRGGVELELYQTIQDNFSQSIMSSKNLFYIFNFSKSQGFIIIAADDRVEPILGYSTTNDFDLTKAPAQVISWLNNYKKQIARVLVSASENVHPFWEEYSKPLNYRKRGSNSAVAPLLKTTWSQDVNYYELCPKDPATGKTSVTGCVATAMAQTMKYWNYPSQGVGSNTYTPPGGFNSLSADFSLSRYDWLNMPSKPTSTSTAIPLLIRDCGYAVNMQYGSAGSGAEVTGRIYPSAEKALVANFGYSNSMYSRERRFFSNTEWVNFLKTEFDASRVVIYYGYNSTLTSGHCFVADGYDANNYIHINWGWGGYYDGYFTVNSLAPTTTDNYSTMDGALFGIQPASCNDGIAGLSEVCLNSNTTLTAPVLGGSWSTSNDQVAVVTPEGVLQAKGIGSAIIYYNMPLNSSCGNVTLSKSITVVGRLQKPTAILGDIAICQLETKQFTLSSQVPGHWTSLDAKINVFDNGKVQGVTTGKAMLIYSFGNACYDVYDTITKWITVKATPVIPLIKGVDSLCVNTTAQYSNTLTGGVWSVSDSYSSVSTSGLLKGSGAGFTTLNYAVKGSSGCVGTTTKKIKVKAAPIVVITGLDSLCQNASATYIASLPNGTWSVLNTYVSTTNGLTLAKSPGASGVKYTLTQSGCTATTTKNIYVKSLPATGSISGVSSFCGVNTAGYTSSVKGGAWTISNPSVFTIDPNGIVKTTNLSNSTAVISYTTKAKNCTNATTKSISVVALPVVSITGYDALTVKQQATYKASTGGGIWSVLDNHLTVTSTGLVTAVSANTSGSGVKYMLTGTGVCSGKTSIATKNITILAPTALQLATTPNVTFYPNPTGGIVYLASDEPMERITLIDMLGRSVQDEMFDELTHQVDYTNVKTGNYLLVVTHKNGMMSNHSIRIESF